MRRSGTSWFIVPLRAAVCPTEVIPRRSVFYCGPLDRSAQAALLNLLRSDTPPSAAAAAPRSIRDRITIRNDELDAGRPLITEIVRIWR